MKANLNDLNCYSADSSDSSGTAIYSSCIHVSTLHTEKELKLSKTLAVLEYDTGLTEDKLMEYIEIIERLGQITIDLENDKIKKPMA